LYDWVVLTSPNAARRFVQTVDAAGVGVERPRIAAVGPGTASVVTAAGKAVHLVPRRTIGEGLVEAFATGPGRVLLPRAEVARDVVPDGLRAKGWEVDVVEAYRTVPVTPQDADLARLDAADLVCFTSSSTVDALVSAAGMARLPAIIVSMGIATTATAMARGLVVDVTAEPSTLDGLLDAVVRAWRTSDTSYPLRP
jgi:uroporphyrinogen-III synthase